MTDVEDHFLETFDRRLRGAATEAELQALHEHARTCAMCALQLNLRGGLESARTPLDERLDGRVIESVLLRTRAGRGPRHRTVWVLAAAATLVAALAAARGLWLGDQAESAASHAPGPQQTTPRALSSGEPRTVAERTIAPPIQHAPEPRQPSIAPSGNEPRTTTAAETAVGLFAKANQLRRQGVDEQALDAYRKLQSRFATSPEARQSYATMGWLLLDRGRPREALEQFDHYLRGGGPGSEDALGGRALSLQRLGRAADERQALEMLVQRFPESAHAARAKLRLKELR